MTGLHKNTKNLKTLFCNLWHCLSNQKKRRKEESPLRWLNDKIIEHKETTYMIEKYKLWKTDLDPQSKMEYKKLLEKLQVPRLFWLSRQPGSTIESKMRLVSQRSHVSC